MKTKTRYILAILVALVTAIIGGVTILKVQFGGELIEAVRVALPKLRVVRAGNCDYIYDRDDGKLVATKCTSDPSAYQKTVEDLRGQLQRSENEIEKAKARVAELEKELIAQADARSQELSACKAKLDALTAVPQCEDDSEHGRLCCRTGFYAAKNKEGRVACYERP